MLGADVYLLCIIYVVHQCQGGVVVSRSRRVAPCTYVSYRVSFHCNVDRVVIQVVILLWLG